MTFSREREMKIAVCFRRWRRGETRNTIIIRSPGTKYRHQMDKNISRRIKVFLMSDAKFRRNVAFPGAGIEFLSNGMISVSVDINLTTIYPPSHSILQHLSFINIYREQLDSKLFSLRSYLTNQRRDLQPYPTDIYGQMHRNSASSSH